MDCVSFGVIYIRLKCVWGVGNLTQYEHGIQTEKIICKTGDHRSVLVCPKGPYAPVFPLVYTETSWSL